MKEMKERKNICIIGCGVSGLTSLKSCLEENLNAIVYEQSKNFGGLWCYTEEIDEKNSSVMHATVANNSKEISAFSDFPPPAEFPNYMPHTIMYKYLDLYVKQFDLLKYIKFEHEVIKVVPTIDHNITGQWSVAVKNKITETIEVNTYDGVMICSGHYNKPIIPFYNNQKLFTGTVLHSHEYKKPDSFKDKRVVVIGMGNSGADIAVDLAKHTKKLYFSTRRGSWIYPRYWLYGVPIDAALISRFIEILMHILPFRLRCFLMQQMLNYRFSHEKYKLKPNHSPLRQYPTINDELPTQILNGKVKIKNDIEIFGENELKFKGDENYTKIDAVIFATGYQIEYSFIDKELIYSDKDEIELYKFLFSPKLKFSNSICFIGLFQIIGPAMPAFEMQARWFVQLMKGKCAQLPNKNDMMKDIHRKRLQSSRNYYGAKRHAIQTEYIEYMDDLASQFNVKPNLWKYFLTDPQLWYHLMFGPLLAYQYRLTGANEWSGARDAIITYKMRYEYPISN